MKQPMTASRFRALCEAYGGSIERFPEAERQAARELMMREPALRAALHAESELDQLFAAGEAPVLSDALLRKLESLPDRSPQKQPFPLKPRSFWLPAVGWAVAAGFGLWLGTTIDEPEFATATAQQVQTDDGDDDEPTVMEIAAGDLSDFGETP